MPFLLNENRRITHLQVFQRQVRYCDIDHHVVQIYVPRRRLYEAQSACASFTNYRATIRGSVLTALRVSIYCSML